jgi:uncharacterized repeat protein (TIGR01451 family)
VRAELSARQLLVIWLLLLAPLVRAGQCEEHSALINGGFETPFISGSTPVPVETYTGVKLYNQTNVPGWRTLGPSGAIELWQTITSGVPAYAGQQFNEVQGHSQHSIYQDVTSVPGSTIRWQFAHRGRQGNDTIEVRLGSTSSTVAQSRFTTGTTGWQVYSGTYVVPANQTTTRFELKPISSVGGPSVGNLVDAASLSVLCDYGDAPAGFPVRNVDGGAAHIVVQASRLGPLIDAEADGVTSSDAGNDDRTTSDDEDGLLAPATIYHLGASNILSVQTRVNGFVSVWIDVGRDGTWQSGDQLITDVPVVAGTNNLSFSLPLGGSPGSAALRIRLTQNNPSGALGVGGYWANGEVEDHFVTLAITAHLRYRFDEFEWTGSGTEALNSGTAGPGGSAAGGVNTNQPLPALSGVSGTCSFGTFDGNNDAVNLGYIAELDQTYPPDGLTLAAWVRSRRTISGEQMILVRGVAGSGSALQELALYTANGRYELRQRRGSTSLTIGSAIPGADLGNWVHLAAVYDGSVWRLYRNGSVLSTSASTTGPQPNAQAMWAIGARHPNNGGGSAFQGDIDEVQLWRRALQASEVAALGTERHACPQANLLVLKSVAAESDSNGGTNPKSTPGSTAVYTITVTNTGAGGTDRSSLLLTDFLPAELEFWSGDFDGAGSPLWFLNGSPSSGLVWLFTGLASTTDRVEFADGSGQVIVPNGGYDPAVRELRIRFDERMRPAGSSFSVRFRVRVK